MAAPVYYGLAVDSSYSTNNVPVHLNGYFEVDDSLALSHGSGQLTTVDLEFFGMPAGPYAIGQQYGDDLSVGGNPGNPNYLLVQRPSDGAVVTFLDGVPTDVSYTQQRHYGDHDYTEFYLYASTSHPSDVGAHGFEQFTNFDAVGSYSIGGQIPAVPEPQTWALMFAGFAAIGSVVRRRIPRKGD